MKSLKRLAAAAAMVALTGAAQAALISQGNGTVLDTNTNLIWLQDWEVNGQQNWATQKAWAETGLDGFAGSNDWVLPSISQYADLFTAYGNLTLVPQFTNVLSSEYWSGTEEAIPNVALIIRTASGGQRLAPKGGASYAVAVRDGNVAEVPEPQTLALALLALGATVVARRRRSR